MRRLSLRRAGERARVAYGASVRVPGCVADVRVLVSAVGAEVRLTRMVGRGRGERRRERGPWSDEIIGYVAGGGGAPRAGRGEERRGVFPDGTQWDAGLNHGAR